MFNKKLLLKINNPCSEDWSRMKSISCGKFCGVCEKDLIDFMRMNDDELIRSLKNYSGKPCGRLRKDQLNRILMAKKNSWKNIIPKWVTALLLWLAAENVQAGNDLNKNNIIENYPADNRNDVIHKNKNAPDSLARYIKGKIIDTETKEELIGVNILIRETQSGVATDIDGNFNLMIPYHYLEDTITLEISYIGFEKKVIVINRRTDRKTLEIQLQLIGMEEHIVGLIEYQPPRWKFWKRR